MDTTLPFRLRSAPKIFCSLADALEWVLLENGVTNSIHYLDDFLTMGRPNSKECQENLDTMISICRRLGLPLSIHKIEGPSMTIVFLGIELDSELLLIRIPEDKLTQLVSTLNDWTQKKACTKRQLPSLIGQLSHVCKAIPAGRAFLRRMIDLSCKPRKMGHWVRLNSEFHSDLLWWKTFIASWNGTTMMAALNLPTEPDAVLWSDASGSWGCGAYSGVQWFQCKWSDTWQPFAIAVKELLPIAIACGLWGHLWKHKTILAKCDNMGVVHILHSRTSKDPVIMHLGAFSSLLQSSSLG